MGNTPLDRLAWIGAEGKMVNLPTVIADRFGVTKGEARRLMVQGEVTLDDEEVSRTDIPIADIEGRMLRIGKREAVEL